MKIPVSLLSALFSCVFKTTKEVSRGLGPQLSAAVHSISKIGMKRMKEIIAALPIFVLFVRELLRQRSEIQAQEET